MLLSHPVISIVIPTYTRSDKLRECLKSLSEYTENAEIIVVANGAKEETRDICNQYPVKLLWFDEPIGYSKACNAGMKASSGEFIVLLNDDALFLSQPKNENLDVMLKPMLADERVGITGPLKEYDPNSGYDFIIFFCVMLRRKMLDEIGLLDEIFTPYFGEDTDLCVRAERAGWKVVRVPEEHPTKLEPLDPNTTTLEPWKHDKIHIGNFRIFHDAESTIGHLLGSEDVLRRNRQLLKERYGMTCPCDAPQENKKCEHELYLWRANLIDGWFGLDEGHQLAQWVHELPKGAKVLEIGSWHGRSSRFIADNLSENGQLWAVDTFNGSSGEPEMHGTAHWDRGDHAFQWWWCNLQEHIITGHVVPVRMHSENAAATFTHLVEKGQLPKFDLIFIDGDHSEEGIKSDVEAWLPLLKENGLMCGHDYYKESEGPHWVHVRQYVEKKFPLVQKAATSLWYVRHQAELQYQIDSQYNDPEYMKIVESSQRQILGQFFADIPKDANILDVGSGNGVSLRILREMGFTNLKGVDLIEAEGVEVCDMHSLSFESQSFDVVYSSHSLEHAYDPIKVLSEFKRVLKPDGKLFLILPYVEVLDSEHRAKAHAGAEQLGLTIADNAVTLLKTVEDAGFTNTFKEEGTLRNEREIYLKFDVEPPYIYDTFIFNDELDILDIRFATLYDDVDRFVLVEGTKTHSGKDKPLHFDLNRDRYAKYLNKVTHVIVDDYPEFPEPTDLQSRADQAWTRERWQRDAIMRGLQKCKDSDIILIGDADEIANPEAIKSYDPSQGLCRLKQRLFYYYLNCENKDGWDWQKIVPYKMVKELTPCGVRYPPAGHAPLIENAGWHFSFIGNTDAIMKKIQDYAHVEYATDEILNKERIEKLISEGRDVFGRDLKYEFVEIGDNYPAYVKENAASLIQKGFVRTSKTVVSDFAQVGANSWAFNPYQGWHSLTVTAEVCTKDRYHLLPAVITAIANQTRKPDRLVIYDDGEQKDFRETPPFDNILKMLDEKGIKWAVMKTPREGQVKNHQHCLDNAETDLIWRVDDDEIPEHDCLENLLKEMKEGVGAVAGLVHHPGNVSDLPNFLDGSLNDIHAGLNLAWFNWNGQAKEVDHLYSTFLYRVEAGRKAGGYPRSLSVVGHREESIFSHSIKRAGYKLILTPFAKTFHLRETKGGIRSFNDHKLWEHDEQVWQSYLTEWGVGQGKPTKIIDANFGRGDHFILKLVFPEIQKRHPDKELIIAACFPDILEDLGCKLISIADAQNIMGERYENALFYKWCWERSWQRSIEEGMLEFWG